MSPAGLAKASLLKTPGGMKYSGQDVLNLLDAGHAFRLPDMHVVALADREDVEYATSIARAAAGRKTPEDSEGFRSAIARAARRLGLAVPVFAAPAASKAGPCPVCRRPAGGHLPACSVGHAARAVKDGARVLKAAAREMTGGKPKPKPGKLSKSERRELAGQAGRFDEMARLAADPADARGYRELAAEARDRVAAGVR